MSEPERKDFEERLRTLRAIVESWTEEERERACAELESKMARIDAEQEQHHV